MFGTTVRLLRALGYRVTRLSEIGATDLADPAVLAIAVARSELLLTADKDFCDILQFPPGSHRGIVVLRIDAESEASVHAVLVRMFLEHPPSTLDGTLAVVSAGKYRLRPPLTPANRGRYTEGGGESP